MKGYGGAEAKALVEPGCEAAQHLFHFKAGINFLVFSAGELQNAFASAPPYPFTGYYPANQCYRLGGQFIFTQKVG